MQVNSTNNVNFTSLIPTRVYINGLQSTDTKFIRQACNKATDLLTGPVKEQPKYKDFIIKLGHLDFEFMPQASWLGYKTTQGEKNKSEFFRILFDTNNRAYITTGNDTEMLVNAGKNIGKQKGICNDFNISNSFEYQLAKDTYKETLYGKLLKYIEKRRIKYNAEDTNGNLVAKPVSMDIYVTAKTSKRKGETVLKDMKLEDLKLSLE